MPEESDAPTSYSWLRETRPFSISDAFAVVPPMSNAIAFAWPSASRERARRDDARGRAGLERVHGPFRSGLGGHDAAGRLHDRQLGVPRRARAAARRRSAPSAAGRTRSRPSSPCARTPAARAGSRDESETGMPGSSSRRIVPSRCSCAGWRCACSRQTATDSTPASRSCAATRAGIAPRRAAACTVPSASTRSATSKRSRRSTSGGGFAQK